MKLRKLALASLFVGFVPATQAAIWDFTFTDRGVDYSLSFDSLAAGSGGTSTGHYTLTLDTTGYNQQPAATAYLDSVDIKAWSGTDISFTYTAPGGTSAWIPSQGPISSGPASNAGCGDSGSGFACLEAATKGVFSVLAGNPYTFTFDVTSATASFLQVLGAGVHVGAGYADALGNGNGFGVTSVTGGTTPPIPEPETYAMMLVGFTLLGFVARRRRQFLGGNVVPA